MSALRTFLLSLVLAAFALPAQAAELIMFDDPTCIYCKKWLSEVGPGYPRSVEGRRAPLRRVQIRDQARLGVAFKTPITATPTFVLAEAGREVGRITGYPGPDYFYPMLDEVLRKLPAPTPARPALRETKSMLDD